jgi:hypothetical protein
MWWCKLSRIRWGAPAPARARYDYVICADEAGEAKSKRVQRRNNPSLSLAFFEPRRPAKCDHWLLHTVSFLIDKVRKSDLAWACELDVDVKWGIILDGLEVLSQIAEPTKTLQQPLTSNVGRTSSSFNNAGRTWPFPTTTSQDEPMANWNRASRAGAIRYYLITNFRQSFLSLSLLSP